MVVMNVVVMNNNEDSNVNVSTMVEMMGLKQMVPDVWNLLVLDYMGRKRMEQTNVTKQQYQYQ
jgi:hypothetical protein